MSGFAVSYHSGTKLLSGCYPVDSKNDVPDGWSFVKDYPGEANELPTVAVEKARLLAYSDPFSGSDRYMFEALTEQAAGNTAEYESALAKSLERKDQIKKENPWP
jgi:hypothetical protein